MRIPGAAVASLSGIALMTSIGCSSIKESHSFFVGTSPCRHSTVFINSLSADKNQRVILSVSTAESSSTDENKSRISNEISSGVRLTGNTIDDEISVVDYASVSDQNSLMEKALRDAREIHLNPDANLIRTSEAPHRLMGINDEVVKTVGHEIGDFPVLVSNSEILQKSAAYLRSKASVDLFEPMPSSNTISVNDFSPDEVSQYMNLLDVAFTESGEVTSAFAKTFYLGTTLLPPPAQKAIWAIYVWCRRTDEIVDAPRNLGSDEENNAAMLQDLAAWELRLENLWKYGEVVDVLDLPLLDVRVNYPLLTIEPFVDMIRGMLMDIPGLGVERYREWEELHLYCYRVAGTVGLMSMPIFGTKPGVTMEDAKEQALSLGVAFQITNILRDVGEDASTRKRIYLPTSHLEKFNVSESQLFAQQIDDNYRNLMKYEIALARKYYDKAQEGVYMLSEEGRMPVQTSLDCYRKILNKIEENNYDTLTTRAFVSKWEKIATMPFSWYRTQEINKVLPMPDDW